MVLSSLLSSGTSSSSLVDQVEFLILLLIVTLIVALLSRRLRVPYTLLLAIIGLFEQFGVPDRLRTLVEGESIFNDGTGAQPTNWCWPCCCPPWGWPRRRAIPRF